MKLFHPESLALNEVVSLKHSAISDERGFFTKIFSDIDFKLLGWDKPISQVNYSYTLNAGSIRGMHYQLEPYSEDKLVVCLSGSVIDIAVDVRPNSATYLKNCSKTLSAGNNYSMLIPKGFAHGFQSLENNVALLYLHSATHSVEYERRINPLDPALNIKWPLAITNISKLDQSSPFL